MYVAAALCMWFLRAWKIGQIQQVAAEQEKAPGDVDAVSAPAPESSTHSATPTRAKSRIVKRLLAWKRV